MGFTTELKVRGFHIDVFGHMNNARYLELMEEARWQYVEATQFGGYLKAHNWGFAVVNINISYKRPAFAGNIITFKIEVTRMGNSSMTLQQNMYLKGTDTLIATADVTFVVLNLANNKPVRITDELKEAFTLKENSKA
jgi:thioesterase-3